MTKKKDPKDNKQGQGGGRPLTVFDAAMIKQVEGFAAVMTSAQMADYFGISENTLREVMHRQPEVSEAYKRGRASVIALVAQNLITKAKNGDTASAIFFLKTQAGWKETQVVDHTSTDRSMSPRELTDDELKAERKKYGIPEPK